MTQHLGVPRETQLRGQEGCHQWSRPWPTGPKRARMEVSVGGEHSRDKVPWSLQAALLLLPIYGPLEAAFPFVLPNKLTPDFQVSQGLGKHLSGLVPHFVFASAAGIWALCADKRHPWGSAGVPTFCSPKAPAASVPGWSLSVHRKSSLVPPCLKCHPILSLTRAPQGRNRVWALSVRQSHLVAVSLKCLGEGGRGSL